MPQRIMLEDGTSLTRIDIETHPGEVLYINVGDQNVGTIRTIDQDGICGMQVITVKEKL